MYHNCAGSLDIIDTRTCSHVQTVPNLGLSIDSVSISCSGAHTAIAAATQSSGTFSNSIQANIAIFLATDGSSWERRSLLSQCENKVLLHVPNTVAGNIIILVLLLQIIRCRSPRYLCFLMKETVKVTLPFSIPHQLALVSVLSSRRLHLYWHQ